ncbi:MAG: AI-2E family transporter [Eubacteriales bacterium]|nr:AI-2E family transporter [Eubacteriales bacterium]
MEENKKENRYIKLGITLFLVLLAVVISYFILRDISSIAKFINIILKSLSSIFIGFTLAYIFSPLYNMIRNFIIKIFKNTKFKTKKILTFAKVISTIICILLVLIIVFGLLLLMIPDLVKSINDLIKNLPSYSANLSIVLNYFHLEEYEKQFKEWYNLFQTNIIQFILSFSQNYGKSLLKGVYSSVSSFIYIIVDFFVGIIAMIYLLNSKEKLLSQYRKIVFALLSKKNAISFMRECKYVHKIFGSFISGKLLDSLIIGIMCYIGLLILKTPYALIVSVIIGITNVIPFFGPFIGAIPSIILIALAEPIQGVYFAIFILILQQFDGNILGPLILGDRTGVASFYVLVSILLFGTLWGFVGMLLAVPLWAIMQHIINYFCKKELLKKNLPIDSIDYSYEKVDEMCKENIQ